MSQAAATPQAVSVIDIGASAIRMVIAQVSEKGEISHLDQLQKPIQFGRDVFASGRIGRTAMNEAIRILLNFKQVCDTYGVTRIQAVATSAVREATNRDNFIDRVYVRTGIDVEVIEGPEENRLELISVENALKGKINLDEKNCLIVEVSSGSTDVILLTKGKVEVTRTLSLGTMRLPEMMDATKTDPESLQRALKRSVREAVAHLAREYNFQDVDTFIAVGGDMRFASAQLVENAGPENFRILDKKAFTNFLGKISKMTPNEIARQYGLPYNQSELLYASLLFYYNFMQVTKVNEIVAPLVSIRDGILIEVAQLVSGYKRTDVSKQIISSARHLGEKYQYDKNHTGLIASHAVKLFDELQQDHGMNSLDRMLLEVSAILHDIGSFISPTSHHKHSSYLVDASEIFGLRKSDKTIVSNVVRYHRKGGPKATHVPYMSLTKLDRSRVAKLAAILRIADCLDAGHQQRIRSFTLERTDKAYVIWVPADVGDISLERTAVESKGGFFADLFGIPVTLRRVKE